MTPAIHTVVCDLDGVVWLDRCAIPGAAAAVEALRDVGIRVVFATNNSTAPIADHERSLEAVGIPAVGDVVTSAGAVASMLSTGDRVLVVGEAGIVEAVEARGARIVPWTARARSAEVVVVGLDRQVDYDRIRRAADAVRGGARFLATNDDATFPTPDGPIPGAGAVVAAVSTASGRSPSLAGKPHHPMAALVASTIGDGFDADRTLVIGDRPSTDGAFASTIGARFALVRSGITPPGSVPEPGGPEPWLDAPDLAAVARRVIHDRAGGGSDSVTAW